MPFRADRFNRIYKETTGGSCRYVNVGEYHDRTTPKQKAAFLNEAVAKIENGIGKGKLRVVMQKCGMECIGASTLKKARTLYAASSSLESFLEALNAHRIGGGHLSLKGSIIDASYDKCYCGSVSQSKEKYSKTYCYCSAGWYKRLFEEVLQREIKVDLVQSIINGADRCRFKIHIRSTRHAGG